MKKTIGLAVLIAASAIPTYATSCGTFASPTACTITVGGINTFTLSNFSFSSATQTGGGNLYQGGDVNIDIATGGALTLFMSFTKNASGPTSGVTFFTNPGQTSGFILQYDVTLSAALPGTAAFDVPSIVDTNGNATQNATGTAQLILAGSPGVSCQAIENLNSSNQGTCNSLPGGLGLTLHVSDILSFTGNSGNVSLSSFSNLFSSTFSAAAVPEPTTYALIGCGLAAIAAIRRRRR